MKHVIFWLSAALAILWQFVARNEAAGCAFAAACLVMNYIDFKIGELK